MSARFIRSLPVGQAHLDQLLGPLERLRAEVDRLERWAATLRDTFAGGGRLLACGNGGSAAEAQHLTAELVGRYRDDRPPYSAIALCAEGASLTAIGNDYGADQAFARQVRAHARPGDVLVAISTSGRSPNVVRAAVVAAQCGVHAWALTGRGPNPLSERCDDALCVDSPHTATVQEVHLVAVHMLCAAFDVACGPPRLTEPAPDAAAPYGWQLA